MLRDGVPDDLRPGERVLLVARRHPLIFLRRSLPALASLLAAVLLLAGAAALSMEFLLPVLGLPLAAIALWLLWLWADWRADMLVLTDRRVLWVERKPLVREHQWQAPLGGIQNVAAITPGPVERLTGCADLVLDTASRGVQTLPGIRRANGVAGAVLAAQRHSSRRTTRLGRLQAQMGLAPVRPRPCAQPPGIRVWRRHPAMLARPLLPSLALLLAGGTASTGLGAPHAAFEAAVAASLWGLWVWDNWRNDEIVVTADRIIQTRRSPLALHRETWQAALDKVQDISYTIPSPLAHLLGYGTVTVLTGGDGQDFNLAGLPQPREIAAELNDRLALARERKERAMIREVESTVRSVLQEYGLVPRPDG